MHVVLGDGEMTRRELTETLADLWDKDEKDKQSFWFLIQGKSEPTDTDKALVTWLTKNTIYYEVVTDDPESMSDIYIEPQETHTAKKLSQKVVSLLQAKPEEDEGAEILALFVDVSDVRAPEDRWLNGVIQSASDAGYPTRALNDGLVEIDLSDSAAEPEPATVTPITKKSVAKKVAPQPAIPATSDMTTADTEVSEEDVPEPAPAAPTSAEIPTREELEEMEPAEVKNVAAAMGITLPPRTRATTYIDHILGEGKADAPPVELTKEYADANTPVYNGDLDMDALADKVVDMIWERIQKAFTA